ncbi:g10664 [Coccomyxa viridis]|uniref:Ribosomal RNA-processing protein 42 n=1 Tax=Coccomyxa viridis TaxID=1274662 RepID=A0ABP1GAH0_9CHLO
MIGSDEKDFIRGGFKADIRSDGRACNDSRPLSLSLGDLQPCSGSARCTLGSTDVIVGVKAELGAPLPDSPDCGGLHITVECSPCAGPTSQGRAGEALSFELAKCLERALNAHPSGRGSALDLRALSIVSGRTCWVLCIDALVLACDGSLLDALSIAVRAALQNTRIPLVEVGATEDPDEEPELELDDDPANAKQVDVSRVPIIVTVCQMDDAFVVDPTAREEEAAEQACHIAVMPTGNVCGMFRGSGAAVTPFALQEMMSLAQKRGPLLLQAVGKSIASAAMSMET